MSDSADPQQPYIPPKPPLPPQPAPESQAPVAPPADPVAPVATPAPPAPAPGGFAPPTAPPGYAQPQAYAHPQDYAQTQAYPQPQAHGEPQGYTQPQAYGQPQAYAQPQPSAPPYAAPYVPNVSYGPPPVAPAGKRSGMLGVVALLLSLVAAVLAPVAVAIAGFNVGVGTGREIALRQLDANFDWSLLSPVRDWVLLGEISFWVGTAVGIWAIVQGIIAIVKNRGRGQGIAALVIAVLGPVIWGIVLQAALVAGFASGASVGG